MSELIHDIFAKRGASMTTGANDPLPLIDPGAVWLVTRGHVDVVAMTIMRDGGASDLQRTHLLRIGAGQLLFGFRAPGAGHNVLLLGFGSAGAEVSRMEVERLGGEAAADVKVSAELAPLVDRWVATVCAVCSSDLPPMGTQNLRAGSECSLEAGQSAQPQSGVLWLRAIRGAARFMGQDADAVISGDVLFPLSKDAWVGAEEACTLEALPSGVVAMGETYWRGLDVFHNTVDTVIDIQRTRDREQARRRLFAKHEASRFTVASAISDLQSILSQRRIMRTAPTAETALLHACRLVGAPAGIDVREPSRGGRGEGFSNPLEQIAAISRFALRRVQLRSGWRRQDGGPLLGFLREGGSPIALLPVSATAYEAHDPVSGGVRAVTAGVAEELDSNAFAFYRCLPDRPLKGIDLARFASRGVGRDALTVALIGAVGGLLALATPVAIGHVFDSVIPGAEHAQLWQLTLGLIVAALAGAAFQATRNIALIRIQHRAGAALQAAVWERLVNLPVRFFAKYSAGDLATRAMGIDTMMETLSTTAITSIVTSVFSLFSLALLVYYSPITAAAAVGMILIIVLAIIATGIVQARCQRAIEDSRGRMAGMLLQFMNGMAKIRVAAAEDRAFGQWAERFANQTRLVLRSRAAANHLDTFGAAFPVLAYMVIFLLVTRAGASSGARMSTGSFLGFIAAFSTLLGAMMTMGHVVVRLLHIVPVYDRLRPVLEAAPEIDPGKADPGPLRGRIEVSNVTFRYEKDGPAILQDLSFFADPGEFIAVVGPSGSGKSTLLRILLGFEKPEAGAIMFDGFDLSGLDPRALRRQLGVVLQDGDLLPGDIFSNIVGSAVDLTLEDAWEAARLAGLAEDIEEMPMGMHTVLAEGAATLSGGQRQRLMIARALVTKPRIVFFDEATSALDNPTQAIVTRSLDRLRATRIVIAHRLSTIVNADRIYVVERGRVVQSGAYEELVAAPGLFLDLVKRQIA